MPPWRRLFYRVKIIFRLQQSSLTADTHNTMFSKESTEIHMGLDTKSGHKKETAAGWKSFNSDVRRVRPNNQTNALLYFKKCQC